jgi:acyl phosphate:glycerol-3-phosphate acyltransferase
VPETRLACRHGVSGKHQALSPQESGMLPWLIIVIGYLLGSFPTAFIAGRIIKGEDIRQMGDENAGAANAYRELGHRAGIVVGVIDAAKGALVILIARALEMPLAAVMLAGLAAVIGHNWPVYLGFRGGRGVSTILGILLVLVPLPMLILLVVALLVLIVKKSVTLAIACLFILLPLVDWWLGVPPELTIYGLGLAALAGVTHYLRVRSRALGQA